MQEVWLSAKRLGHEVGAAGADDDDLELGVLAKGGLLNLKQGVAFIPLKGYSKG